MQKLIKRIFYGAPARTARPAAQGSLPAMQDSPVTIEDGSENATRRQLVQVLLRDLLKRCGIPVPWIECQMLLVSSRTRGHGMYVRLVIKQWDARLMDYTYAFQNALMADIERFEPHAAEWLHGISWQLDLGETCPYQALPEKAYWDAPLKKPLPKVQAKVVVPSVPEAPPPRVDFESTNVDEETNRARDLEALFAIRDEELARKIADGLMPVGYEKTQPSPLESN